MLSKEEIEKAKGWLSALNVKSEYEATTKEIILQYIEQLETELKEVTTQRNKLATDLSDNEDNKQELIKELENALDFVKTGDDIISKTQVTCLENVLKIAKGEEILSKEKPDTRNLCEECSAIAKEAGFTKADTDRIIKESRQIIVKANKYDSLVKKMKDKVEELENHFLGDREDFASDVLRKLLKETEDEQSR